MPPDRLGVPQNQCLALPLQHALDLVGETHPLGPVGLLVLNRGYRGLNLEYPVLKGVLVWPAGHLDYL